MINEEAIASLIPTVGLSLILVQMVFKCLALAIASAVVRDFRLDWEAGYGIVAAGAAVVATSYLLSWLLFGGIAFFISLK